MWAQSGFVFKFLLFICGSRLHSIGRHKQINKRCPRISLTNLTLPCNSYSELVRQYGIGIRVLGDTSLLPDDVRKVIRKAVDLTKKNNRAILNMCFPYTSREELTMATRSLVSGIEAHDLNPR